MGRFSSFVKTGSEAYILGNVPNKVAIKHSDKLKIIISPESEFACICGYMYVHVETCMYTWRHACTCGDVHVHTYGAN